MTFGREGKPRLTAQLLEKYLRVMIFLNSGEDKCHLQDPPFHHRKPSNFYWGDLF
jgi:hypothetical protein